MCILSFNIPFLLSTRKTLLSYLGATLELSMGYFLLFFFFSLGREKGGDCGGESREFI